MVNPIVPVVLIPLLSVHNNYTKCRLISKNMINVRFDVQRNQEINLQTFMHL